MTQEYIITEEKLAGMIYYFYNGFFTDGSNIAAEVRSRPYTNEREKVHTKQCVNCIRRGLRECMYHGYPEETIPLSCAYKIGDAAVNTVYDVPVATRKRGEQK